MNEIIENELLEEREYLTVKELMKTLNISENTLYRWVRKGRLNPTKFRNKNYFKTSDIKQYLNKVFNNETVEEYS
ncbi:helix-turn-helix domain-containing protein [Gracilimonas sp. Q87]|uniref:helix-turn-helix domain-containing protein n=1 Tax=Gracilimonas sp. Q87 TaxID=3384766 RepID=UPI0039841B03